jgi:hypothetical protein
MYSDTISIYSKPFDILVDQQRDVVNVYWDDVFYQFEHGISLLALLGQLLEVNSVSNSFASGPENIEPKINDDITLLDLPLNNL